MYTYIIKYICILWYPIILLMPPFPRVAYITIYE